MFLFLACTDRLNGCRRLQLSGQCSFRNVQAYCKKTCGVCTGLFYFSCPNFFIPLPHILLSFYPWGHANSSRGFANALALALFLFDKGAASLLRSVVERGFLDPYTRASAQWYFRSNYLRYKWYSRGTFLFILGPFWLPEWQFSNPLLYLSS